MCTDANRDEDGRNSKPRVVGVVKFDLDADTDVAVKDREVGELHLVHIDVRNPASNQVVWVKSLQ